MVTASVAVYLVLLFLLALERGLELVISRRHEKLLREQGAVEVGKRHFVVMRLLHAAFLISCAAETLYFHRQAPGAWSIVFVLAAFDAQALRYWAMASLGHRWNVRILVLPGEPPVKRGPYRFLRHPNYLAVVIEMACVPMIHGAYGTALAFSVANAIVLAVRIRAEERALGAAYARAFSRCPRLFPGMRRG